MEQTTRGTPTAAATAGDVLEIAELMVLGSPIMMDASRLYTRRDNQIWLKMLFSKEKRARALISPAFGIVNSFCGSPRRAKFYSITI